MKIMQINAVYGVGSTGVITADIHQLSLNCGIKSFVSYSTSPLGEQEIVNGYSIGNNFEKKIHAVLCRIGGKQAYYSKLATAKLIKHIDLIQPDIVHLHNLHSNYIHLDMLLDFLGKNDIATVITLHDCWFYTGGCFHYTNANCKKWQTSCGGCPKQHQDTPAYFYDNSANILADRIKYFKNIKKLTVVGVSEWISKEAEKSFLKGNKILTIYNGIDTEYFKNTPSDFRKKYNIEDKFVILGAANKWLNSVNGELLKFVTDKLPEDSVLLILGCSESQKTNLPSNVIPISYIRDRDELRKLYSACDVFANCTREESLSLINVEAQSCGTPVVTFSNTGVKETVNGECGFAVENGNIEAFFEAINKVKSIGKQAFSNDCREWALEKFDRNKNYQKYIDLYKDIYKNI